MHCPHWINHVKTTSWGRYRTEIRRYLLLLLLPVLVLALLYINANQVVTQQAEEYAELTVDHFHVQTSSMLHEMQLVSSAILRESDVSRILETDYADATDSLYICDIIRAGLRESPYVEHAYLICEKSGNIYSDQGLFGSSSLHVLLKRIGIDESELYAEGTETDFHMLNENGLAPYCIFQIKATDGTFQGALVVTLRMSEFLRIFYSLDAELCTVFGQGVYISSYISPINVASFDWRDEADVSTLVGKPVVCKYIEGEDDYTYMVAVSRESYNRPLNVIVKWAIVYAAAALGLGYFYLYQISKRRYQRISTMVSMMPDSYEGDKSLEHIYENIRKSLEDYHIQREHLRMSGREHILHALLAMGGKQPATAEQFRNVGVEPEQGPYYVATFFSAQGPTLEEGRIPEGGFMPMLFHSTIHELAEAVHISFATCGIPRINVAILYGGDPASLAGTVAALCENAVKVLTNSCLMDIQAAVSNPADSILELPAAYQETQRLHSFAKSIDSSAAVISQEELQRSSGVLLNGDFIRQQQILINTILVGKYDAVPSMVESILADHVSPLRKNYVLAQGRLLSVTNALVEGVRLCTLPDFPNEECANALGQADSVHLLLLLTKQVYGRMEQLSQAVGKEQDPAARACEYISQNLSDQNLNVTAVCETVGIRVQRLTQMFQIQFGMAIAEYINDRRIKLAKELLPDRELTIAQIAQRVGYYNADTFTRNFRKVEGVTPTEYRKMLARD